MCVIVRTEHGDGNNGGDDERVPAASAPEPVMNLHLFA